MNTATQPQCPSTFRKDLHVWLEEFIKYLKECPEEVAKISDKYDLKEDWFMPMPDGIGSFWDMAEIRKLFHKKIREDIKIKARESDIPIAEDVVYTKGEVFDVKYGDNEVDLSNPMDCVVVVPPVGKMARVKAIDSENKVMTLQMHDEEAEGALLKGWDMIFIPGTKNALVI